MEKHLIPVAEHEIADDDLYRLPSFDPIEPLAASIREIGLLNPPLLQRRSDGRLRIVCGFRRLEALRLPALPLKEAWVIEKTQPSADVFLIALLDNAAHKSFNPVQSAAAVRILRRLGVDDREILERFFPVLGLAKNSRLLELLSDLSALPADWQQAVAEDRVGLDQAAAAAHLEPHDRDAFLKLITTLRLGKNRQRELLLLLQDVARLHGIALHKLLSTNDMASVIGAERLTPSQKTERLKEQLWAARYPRYAAAEKRFAELIKAAAFPPDVVLQHSPFFQGDELQIGFTFRSEEEYRSRLEFLQKLLSNGELKSYLELI